MFERFTDRARRVLVLAQEEARLLGHSFIGTEHILLGLISEEEGVAAQALKSLGITLEAVRARVDETIGPAGGPTSGSPPFTPRAKKVLELALREALQLGHSYIGTEHILLGLVREGEGVAAQGLQSLGADLSSVRQAVISRLSGYQTTLRVESAESWLGRQIDWPRHPTKVIAGPTQVLSSVGLTFRVLGVLLYDDGIEAIWRISGVPAPLIELLEDPAMVPPRNYAKPRGARIRQIVQRRVFSGEGTGISTTTPGFRQDSSGSEERPSLKISVDEGPHYLSALGEFEPIGGGEVAGRSYFVPSVSEGGGPHSNAKSLTVEWQGQSLKVDL